MELSDYALVKNILDGNENDFSLFFNKYKNLVYSEVLKFVNDLCENNTFEVEDITQEVFLRLYKSLKLFNPKYKLSTWITSITKNLCIDKLRSQKHSSSISTNTLNENEYFQNSGITPEKNIIDNESLRFVRKIIMELPKKYKSPIFLYYFEELSYIEMTKLLNISLPTLKNRLYRAKIILKKRIIELDIY